VSLETFRRDGRSVATPIWIAGLEDKLVGLSMANAGKVKRIRATKKVKVAPCTLRGRIIGEWQEGTGRVLTDEKEVQHVRKALRKKYGFLGWFTFTLGGLGGREARRAYIEISLG